MNEKLRLFFCIFCDFQLLASALQKDQMADFALHISADCFFKNFTQCKPETGFVHPALFYFEYIPFIDIYSISSRIALNKDKIFQMLLKFKLHLKRLTWDIVKVQKFQIFLNQTQYLHLHNAITLEAISRHSKTQESHQYVCVLVSFMVKTIKVKFQSTECGDQSLQEKYLLEMCKNLIKEWTEDSNGLKGRVKPGGGLLVRCNMQGALHSSPLSSHVIMDSSSSLQRVGNLQRHIISIETSKPCLCLQNLDRQGIII